LVATNTGGSNFAGTATILDDGTGDYWIGDETEPATPEELADEGIVLDDDRPLFVSNITVHESLGHAVFTVSGAPDQQLLLRTEEGTADNSDYGPDLEYFDGTDWVVYTGGFLTLPASGELQVRVALVDDGIDEGLEIFQLVATNSGGSDFEGTARVPDRVVELYVMEGTTAVAAYNSYFSGYDTYRVVGGSDAASFIPNGSEDLSFDSPVVYTLGGDNQYPVVSEATAEGVDPDQVLFIVNVMSFKAIGFTPLTELQLDRQSGLYKQQVRVSNLHVHAIGGVRFGVKLIDGAVLFNANGTAEDGSAVIRYDGVLAATGLAGDSVDMTIEVLYQPLSSTQGGAGATLPNPSYTADLIVMDPQGPPAAPASDAPALGFVRLFNGDCMIEWNAVPGRTYAVEYSADLADWVRVHPTVRANTHKIQWIDNGLPKTVSHPSQAPARFYRVVEVNP